MARRRIGRVPGRGRRWNPALHPRNPRDGKFVDRAGGGRWAAAAADQMDIRTLERRQAGKVEPINDQDRTFWRKFVEMPYTPREWKTPGQIENGMAARLSNPDTGRPEWGRVVTTGSRGGGPYIQTKTEQGLILESGHQSVMIEVIDIDGAAARRRARLQDAEERRQQMWDYFEREVAPNQHERRQIHQLEPGWAIRVRHPDTKKMVWASIEGQSQGGGRNRLELVSRDGERFYVTLGSRVTVDAYNLVKQHKRRQVLQRGLGESARGADADRMMQYRQDAARPARIRQTNRQANEAQSLKSIAEMEANVWRFEDDLADTTRRMEELADQFGYRGKDRDEYLDSVLAESRQRLERARQTLRWERERLEKNRNAAYPELDEPAPFGKLTLDESLYDPDRPLAIYGDMLQIGAGQATREHLRQAERIPAIFHRAIARHIAQRETGKIVFGVKSVAELGFQSSGGERPRGWSKGKTWEDVDGVYSPSLRMAVAGYTANTESKGGHTSGSAAAHELGHALDDALGGGQMFGASKTSQWRQAYAAVVEEGKRSGKLSPYFLQKGEAGPQEMWAEAFAAWARRSDDPEARRNSLAIDLGIWSGGEAVRLLDSYFSGIAELMEIEDG